MSNNHVRRLEWVRSQLEDPNIAELLFTKMVGIRDRGLYAQLTKVIEFILNVPEVKKGTIAALIAAVQHASGDKDAIDLVDLRLTVWGVMDVVDDHQGMDRLWRALGRNLASFIVASDIDPFH